MCLDVGWLLWGVGLPGVFREQVWGQMGLGFNHQATALDTSVILLSLSFPVYNPSIVTATSQGRSYAA